MSETPSSRLFVAIPVPTEVKTALQQVQQELRRMVPAALVSWTKPDNLHLTVRFLGNVGGHRVVELQDRLRSALNGFGGLQLICERLGGFPDLRQPRVLWASVHDTGGRLVAVANRIEEVVASFAEKPAEARFAGHITLARPRSLRRPDADTIARFVDAAENRGFGAWQAREIKLIQSVLSPGGSRYTTLATFDLANHGHS